MSSLYEEFFNLLRLFTAQLTFVNLFVIKPRDGEREKKMIKRICNNDRVVQFLALITKYRIMYGSTKLWWI